MMDATVLTADREEPTMSNRHKPEVHRIRALFAERFPGAFVPRHTPKKPLKIGIREDLVAACPDLTEYKIRRFLYYYAIGSSYLAAMLPGAPRMGLNGEVAGYVSNGQAEYAGKELMRRGHPESAAKIARAFAERTSLVDAAPK